MSTCLNKLKIKSNVPITLTYSRIYPFDSQWFNNGDNPKKTFKIFLRAKLKT